MLTVGSFTFANRLAGLLNDVMMAAILGCGILTDAFLAAFKIPSLFRKIFDQGAFNGAFIPRFSQVLKKEGHEGAEKTASRVFTILLLFLGVLVGGLEWGREGVLKCLFPGFKKDPFLFSLTVDLLGWCLPYIACATLSAFLGSILNTMGKFAAAAATQLFLNICVISAMVLGALHYPTVVHTMGVSVVIAGIFQVLWLWVFVRRQGFRVTITRDIFTEEVKDIFQRMLPTMISSGLWQINLSINYTLCSLFLLGPISMIFFADRLNQLPLRIIGSMLSIALLPAMTHLIQSNQQKQAIHQFNESLRFVIGLVLPLSGIMVVMSEPIVSLFYEGGRFSPADVVETAHTFAAFAIGLPGYLVSKIFITIFYSYGNTRIPLKSGSIAILINVLASYVLMQFYGYAGLAAGASFSALMNSLYLFRVLVRDYGMKVYATTGRYAVGYLLLTLALGAAIWGVYQLVGPLPGDSLYSKKGLIVGFLGILTAVCTVLRYFVEHPSFQRKLKTFLSPL
jgi:putative peptidoglycan lipid II flippase